MEKFELEEVKQKISKDLYEKYCFIEVEFDKFYSIIESCFKLKGNKINYKNIYSKCMNNIYDYTKELFSQGEFISCLDKYIKTLVPLKKRLMDIKIIDNCVSLVEYIPTFEEYNKLENYFENIIKSVQDEANNINNDLLLSLIEMYKATNGLLEEEIQLKEIKIKDCEGSLDSFTTYLREINQYPLLTAEEERQLFIEYNNGSQEAYDKLIKSNLRLVVFVAKRYRKLGLSILDLVQDGNLGLMTAIQRFEVDRNLRLSSYAVYWIKQAITRAIADKGKTIRISVHKNEALYKYKNDIMNLATKLGRAPEISEIVSYLNLTLEEVQEMNNLILGMVSLNSKVGDDEDSEFGDFIEDNSCDIEDEVLTNDFKEKLEFAIMDSNLTQREVEIIKYTFGLNRFHRCFTMIELEKVYNITHERIRQIKEKALNKLRKSGQIQLLYNYLNEKECEYDVDLPIGKYSDMKDLYKFFKGYSVYKIDTVLDNLSPEEIDVLKKRYTRSEKELILQPLTIEERNALLGVRKKMNQWMRQLEKGVFKPVSKRKKLSMYRNL